MTALWRWTRVSAMALAVLAYGPAAFAQETPAGDAHEEHQSEAAKASGSDQAAKPMGHEMMMARMAALDARIDMMVADMNMFTGDLKTAAIASLLTALVERDKAMRETMMQMHEQMMQKMMGGQGQAPAAGDAGAGMKCCSMKK